METNVQNEGAKRYLKEYESLVDGVNRDSNSTSAQIEELKGGGGPCLLKNSIRLKELNTEKRAWLTIGITIPTNVVHFFATFSYFT